MIKLVALSFEAGFDIAQAFPIGQLSECHAAELILAREVFDISVAVVALNTTTKRMQWQVIHCLRENKFACVHRLTAPTWDSGWKRDADRTDGSSR